MVGSATEQLGGRVGSSAAGVVQSGLGNLPELFISLFALRAGLTRVLIGITVGGVVLGAAACKGPEQLKLGPDASARFDSVRPKLVVLSGMPRNIGCRLSKLQVPGSFCGLTGRAKLKYSAIA